MPQIVDVIVIMNILFRQCREREHDAECGNWLRDLSDPTINASPHTRFLGARLGISSYQELGWGFDLTFDAVGPVT